VKSALAAAVELKLYLWWVSKLEENFCAAERSIVNVDGGEL
jgi:hypothetical protein